MASAKLLLLTNYRPEYRHEWGQKTYYTQLRLAPLGREEAEEFLDVLLGDHSSPQPAPQRGEGDSPRPNGERDRERVRDTSLHDLKQLILDKTQGTPFFMEEIVQDLFEQGVLVRTEVGAVRRNHPSEPVGWVATHPTTALHIPTTVQGVLTARIDRLAPDEKALLQQLAVIGREFPLSLVRQVITISEDELYRVLSALQAKEFLYEQPAFPEVEYIFKHALTQEVAYGTVLQERRKALHGQTGQAIEQLYAVNLDEHYSELAHHYSRSGNTEKAIHYLHLAGQQAVQRSANQEAISHLTAALELLKTLPDNAERDVRELSLLAVLGLPVQATQGYGTPEAEAIYTRALQLCQQIGETHHLSPVLWGVWVFYLARAELQTARNLGQQLLDLARKTQDSALFVEAHFTLADTLFHLGDFLSALEHANQGLSCYDPQRHQTMAFSRGYDFSVISECYGAWSLWALGHVDQARKRMQNALTLAQEISHPLTLGLALAFASYVYRYCGERQLAKERAEMGIALCAEYGFQYWSAHGIVTRGWDLGEQGKRKEGIAQVREGLALLQTTRVPLDRPYFLAILAEMHADMNEPEEGLAVVAEALAELRGEGERFEAELYRIKGELLLQQSRASLGQVQDKSQASQEKSEDSNTQYPTLSTRRN
ncbi:MAG: hypothetical protein HY268_02620 [Deltaproteobacteria bacterium]|nr:hypothetical protein [Deltaproteobacteria bacterium]